MLNSHKKAFVSLLLLGVTPVLAMTGCAALAAGGAAGAGTVAYFTGELASHVEAPLDAAVAASERALEDLRFTDIAVRTDALKGRLSARDADQQQVSVSLDKQTTNTTKVRIRVGLLGDERVSRAVLDRIEENL